MIRLPRRGSHARDFVAEGMVSFGWDADLTGDLSARSDAQVYLDLEAAGLAKPEDQIKDLRMFADRMSAGDTVVVLDHTAGDLLFGEITGPYRYAPAGGSHHQQRPTRWFGRLASDQADQLLVAAMTKGRHRIRKLPEQTRWQRLAGEVDDLLGRPATDVPSRSRTATVRRRATSRASSAPKKTVVPDRLCPSCGLLRAPSLFPDGDEYCRDCA